VKDVPHERRIRLDTHDMIGDEIGRFPFSGSLRSLHIQIADEIGQNKPRCYASTTQEMQMGQSIRQLIEDICPRARGSALNPKAVSERAA
jgi:hypothetical protein